MFPHTDHVEMVVLFEREEIKKNIEAKEVKEEVKEVKEETKEEKEETKDQK